MLPFTGWTQVINEILFNPPGTDFPNEYIEIRGPANLVLGAGTYFVSVEGDGGNNPGTVKDVFDLSGVLIGGNSFLALLQKTNTYAPAANATLLVNTGSGAGWGNGNSSSIRHSGQNEMQNASVSFLLITSGTPPQIGDDIDIDDNGTPDGAVWATWTVLDSVGVVADAGDIGYGRINFRRNGGGIASGTIVPVGFTPSYVGRSGNTSGFAAGDWVAGDNLADAPPVWRLSANTVPAGNANALLDHIGSPNFGASPIPGIILKESDGSTSVTESGGIDTYTLNVNVAPSGPVTIQINAGSQTLVSTNGGVSYTNMARVVLTTTATRTITVRAVNDNVVDVSPHHSTITHAVIASSDATRYPVGSRVPDVRVGITDNDVLLLSEVKVNPPNTDEPFEFIELRGSPNALLTNLYLIVFESSADTNPGVASLVIDLRSVQLGNNGLLFVAAPNHPYTISASTRVVTDPQFSQSGGALPNSALSIIVLSSPASITEGLDYDAGDNGVLELLPSGAQILDAISWKGDNDDVPYGGVVLTQSSGSPDAASRFPNNNTPLSVAAWYNGDLSGSSGAGLAFEKNNVSANFPQGSVLTPGGVNNTAPFTTGLVPWSGVIGDPLNPPLVFTVGDGETSSGGVTITPTSSNPSVVPTANLTITSGSGGQRFLHINPVGVGYSTITISVSDGAVNNTYPVPYAASAMGRPGGRFHMGVSDASAAIPIDDDFMFIADDENQILRTYYRDLSGLHLVGYNMTPFLNLLDIENGVPREVDIEGATRVANRIFWIGAHSHAGNAESRTNRSRFFATDISGDGSASVLSYVGRYEHFKTDLLAWDANNVHGKGANYYGLGASAQEGVDPKAPDGAGLNIEGVTMAPGSSTIAYIAFRAPLVPPTNRSKALLLPVNNFASLAVSGAAPGATQFGAPIELNLGGRGFRSIEASGSNVLIVAGPPGQSTGIPYEFRLFTWSGDPASVPQERAADLTGMNPEALVELPSLPWSDSSQVQILSDNGFTDFYGDGKSAKHLPYPNFKKFRSDRVTFGPVVVSRPIIRDLRRVGTNLIITWHAKPGYRYRVQFRSQPHSGTWTSFSGEVVATDAIASKTFATSPDEQLFFQVIVVP